MLLALSLYFSCYRKLRNSFKSGSKCVVSAQLFRQMKIEAKWCKPLVSALHSCLQKRFQGIFINCGLEEKSDGDSGRVSHQFDETVHLMATILDPMYRLLWADHFISNSETAALVNRSLKGTVAYYYATF